MEAKIKIKGMTCNHCVNAVTNAISNLDGVKKVEVSLAENMATVEYDEAKVSLQEVEAAIKEEGYEVEEIS